VGYLRPALIPIPGGGSRESPPAAAVLACWLQLLAGNFQLA